MKKYLFEKGIVKIVLEIGNSGEHVSKISHNVYMTFSHCFEIIKLLEKENIVKTYKIGRCRHVSFTRKGWKFYRMLYDIIILVYGNTYVFRREKCRRKYMMYTDISRL
ncbi:MAG: hypothetical protein WA139_02515 [Candidatus Aenigmatarchaeota archaeon]